MESLKIKVNNEAESKEAQELFFELGYSNKAKFTKQDFIRFNGWICALDDGSCDYSPISETDRKITLQELRDMVVLKRETLNDKVASAEVARQDNVNNPSHYTSGGVECLDAMQAMLSRDEFIGFLRGNIFKYQWRYKLKNGIEDLKKAQFYQNKLIEVEAS